MRPLITALVDTYNHECYIEQALVSVLEQGLSSAELEIVAVDDGSTDTTPEIIRKFAPRVKHVRKANGGQASAFNAGFAEAHGQIIATLDGDDWWAKGKLNAVVNALEANPSIGAVSHGYYEFHEDTQEVKLCVPPHAGILSLDTRDAIHEARIAWPYLLPSALTLRRRVMEWIMPIPEEMVFMADSVLQCAAMVMGTMVLKEPLSYYRYHARNLYAVDTKDTTKLRRRSEMGELVYSQLYQRLLELGVPLEKVTALVYPSWIAVKRINLGTFGGSRWKTFRTEMQAFHSEYRHPSPGYSFFKYAIVGVSTLLLPPRWFYYMRDQYSKREMGRLRDRLWKSETTDSK
jgi:glycosyltransferase involved in cell wall biosynthesis